MIIDVHNKTVSEAIDLIKKEIENAYKYGIPTIEVIHGFNNGIAIKTRLLQLKHPYILKIIPRVGNSGSTLINIKMKIY